MSGIPLHHFLSFICLLILPRHYPPSSPFQSTLSPSISPPSYLQILHHCLLLSLPLSNCFPILGVFMLYYFLFLETSCLFLFLSLLYPTPSFLPALYIIYSLTTSSLLNTLLWKSVSRLLCHMFVVCFLFFPSELTLAAESSRGFVPPSSGNSGAVGTETGSRGERALPAWPKEAVFTWGFGRLAPGQEKIFETWHLDETMTRCSSSHTLLCFWCLVSSWFILIVNHFEQKQNYWAVEMQLIGNRFHSSDEVIHPLFYCHESPLCFHFHSQCLI